MKTARQAALESLLKVDCAHGYSNIVIDKVLEETGLSGADRGFACALFYGVIERRMKLDYIISQYAKLPLGKMKPAVVEILRIGIYQLLYMESVPEPAAVNECVKLAKTNRAGTESGFINAVLRAFIRDGKLVSFPQSWSYEEKLSVDYSCPLWLISLWKAQYGAVDAHKLTISTVEQGRIYLRVNSLKTDSETLVKKLAEDGIEADICERIDFCVWVKPGGNLVKTGAFEEGLFHVQDLSSQICAAALGAKNGQVILDLCAAPGGKSFTVAQTAPQAEIYACDLYQSRLSLIDNTSNRLGISNIKTLVSDATVLNPLMPEADVVLCDVPCSGFGIIRKKPEIKYKKSSEIDILPDVQRRILEAGAQYVKPGGRLIYSTCTLNKKENEKVCAAFEKQNADFKRSPVGAGYLQSEITLMPHKDDTDGFFISAFEKAGK